MTHGRFRTTVRTLAVFGAVIAALLALVWGMAWVSRGKLEKIAPVFSKAAVDEAVALRDVKFEKDPAKLPTLFREIKVAPKNQARALKELVDEGKLPPLVERLPEEPVVMEGSDGIGEYGGTWMRLVNTEGDIPNSMSFRLAGAFLCRWSPLGYPIKPFIAKSVESSPDRKVWTITLRKGMRWSNGDPYSADDIMYWWNDELNNPMMNKGELPDWLVLGGKKPTMEKLNDHQFRLTWNEPYAMFREVLSKQLEMVGLPSKYLRRYHPDPKIGDKELIERNMKAYGQSSPQALYLFMKVWNNPDLPRLSPWIYGGYTSSPQQVFVRNPYYFVVDPQGNQLPYIDRIQFQVRDQAMMTIAVANGESSMQDRNVDFSGYTEFMSRRKEAGTRVLHWFSGTRQIWTINVNCTRYIDPHDPSTAKKAELLSDKRFRQAMSLAINRPQIISAEYYGVGTPSQVAPGALSPFDNPDLAAKYANYDPAEANRKLDELGLTKRDFEGYRTFRDGSRMTYYVDVTQFTGRGPIQFVIDDWKAVGVRVMVKEVTRGLYYNLKDAASFDFNVWMSESDYMPMLSPRFFVPVNLESFYATQWARWYMKGGFYDNPQANIKGALNPKTSPGGEPMYEVYSLYEKALRTPDQAEQIKVFRKIHEIDAENVWTIGIATAPPWLVVVDNHLKNVPERAIAGFAYASPSNTGIETYYFDNAKASPDIDRDVKSAIVSPRQRPGAPPPKATAKAGESVDRTGQVIRWGLFGIVLAGAALLIFKHPFVLRRLLILIPSLIVISVIVFTIIQLPPGNFVSQRISYLEASGDPTAAQQIRDLRTTYHTDDPAWRNYLRWMGIDWFRSFDARDQGLLQGNLGRSMESGMLVNDMVGDRITLTIVVSLVTILFTWAIALPIGIYSAVRQYTIGDYIMTFVGFIGMSVPAFLLALILMAMTGATGLFSKEFARMPGWNWPKVMDLMAHIWIPVLVMAVGGTAGMIRVMRANLLDELRKPYVTTARAKGVRPLKLLFKYPVRIALNPFVSGIGHLFPALVSGGSIVAIVLSLPMIGPLLLNSLFAQDIYLAGSMLMVLSLLGVLGTLVSDLLLLWLDPRIRFEGGTR